MIEQRAVAVRRRAQLLEEVREEPDVIAVEHREALVVLLHVRVMRQRVERVAHAALRVDGAAQLLAQQERRDARDLGLPRQHLQVVHQLDVLLDVTRHARRRGRHREIVRELLPGLLHATLDLAHVGQVLIEARAIGGRQLALQRCGFADNRVEQADRLRAARLALLGGVAVAEEPLEDDLRIVLHRQRRVRALPGNRVAIRAAQSVAAVEARLFDRQLERGQRRVLPDLLRDNLIDGDAERRLRAGFGEGAAQDTRRPSDCDSPSRRCRTHCAWRRSLMMLIWL